MSKVSVIIPLHNKRNTVERTLASVLAQTWPNFEVIVIDDGSTDGGAAFAETFLDPRIRVIRQENAGPGAARNRGVREAQGGLVSFLDADDEWMPDFLASAVEALTKNPGCNVFASGFLVRHQGTDTLRTPVVDGPSRWMPDVSTPAAASVLEAFSACNLVYRTATVRRHGGFFEHGCTYAEDVWLWIQVRLNETVFFSREPLGIYHMDTSELGIGSRKSTFPLEPVFTRAADLRDLCPEAMRSTFGIWLGRHALRAGFLHERDGRPDLARWILKEIHETSQWPIERLRLHAKLAFPGLWTSVKACRSAIRGLVPSPAFSPANTPTTTLP